MNCSVIAGRITTDLVLKTAKNGKPYVQFAMGNKIKLGYRYIPKAYFLVAFGGIAESLAKLAKKGTSIAIQGYLDNQVTSENGKVQKVYSRVVVEKFWFMESKESDKEEIEWAEPFFDFAEDMEE